MTSQQLQQQPPRSFQNFHLNLPSNLNDFTKQRGSDEPNCTSVTSIASTNSSARTSVIDFRKKQSFQFMDASIRANTPLSSRATATATATAIESGHSFEEKSSLQISKPISISSTTKSSKALNIGSPKSIDCLDFVSKQQQRIPHDTETTSSISLMSSLTPRNQPHLQSLNVQNPPKIHLKLPSLIKQSQEPLQTLIYTSKTTSSECSRSPNPLLQVKKTTGISIRREMLIPKNLASSRGGAKPVLTPRQSTPIENPLLNSHQRQLSQISASEHTWLDDQQKQRVFSNQRIVLFASLKFQQIDYLRSKFISKEEIFDFFEGRSSSSKSSELPGFKEEEEHLKSNLSFFLKNTQLSSTERSGLVNFREFKNLLKAFFQTQAIQQKSPRTTFSNQNCDRQHHSLSKESKSKVTMSIQQRIQRRELKSAHIYRDKLSIEEVDVKKHQQWYQQQPINLNQNGQGQDILRHKADQNQSQTESNKQNNSQLQSSSSNRQQTPQKPRVIIPRLRSFSIQPEIKMKSDSDSLSKNVQGVFEQTRNDTSSIRNEGYLQRTSQSQSESESFSGATLFECTFQPYHFNQILSQQQAGQDSSRAIAGSQLYSQQSSYPNRQDECTTVNSCSTSFGQSIAVVNASQEVVQQDDTCRSSRQFNQDSRATARSQSKYNSSIGITPMPRAISGNNSEKISGDGIDQNCFNFLLKKEVKVLKKSSLKKQQSFNEDSLNSPIERDNLQAFDASTRVGISKKLLTYFPSDQIESQANNSTTQGYDIQFII